VRLQCKDGVGFEGGWKVRRGGEEKRYERIALSNTKRILMAEGEGDAESERGEAHVRKHCHRFFHVKYACDVHTVYYEPYILLLHNRQCPNEQ